MLPPLTGVSSGALNMFLLKHLFSVVLGRELIAGSSDNSVSAVF